MQINSILQNTTQKTQQVSNDTTPKLHFDEVLSDAKADKITDSDKQSALQNAFINWRNEYISNGFKLD